MRAAAPVQFGGIDLHPPPDATGVDLYAPFRQQLGNVLVGERISQVPTDAKNDHLARKLTSLERIGWGDRHGILRYQTSVPDFAMEPYSAPSALSLAYSLRFAEWWTVSRLRLSRSS